jgi:hypothetical protein
MLRKTILVGIFVLIGSAMTFASGVREEITGNGNVITVERHLGSSFKDIKLSTNASVFIHQNEKSKITLETDSNIEQYITTSVKTGKVYHKDGILRIIGNRKLSLRPTKCVIHIYTPDIINLENSGVGNITIVDKLNIENIAFFVSGVGGIEGTVETNNFVAKISGVGKINLTGKCRNAKIELSSSGTFEGGGFEIEKANVKITGAGGAKVAVSDVLEGEISGSGNIIYSGNPRIKSGQGAGRMEGLL